MTEFLNQQEICADLNTTLTVIFSKKFISFYVQFLAKYDLGDNFVS